MDRFSNLSRKKGLKVIIAVVGIAIMGFLLLILFAIFVVGGLGFGKGVSEIEGIISGSWVIDSDVLGKNQPVEVFSKDGSWQRGNTEGLQRKGTWQYVWDGNQIKIQETEVTLGTTHESVNNERTITILYLGDDSIVCKEDNHQFVLKRVKNMDKKITN